MRLFFFSFKKKEWAKLQKASWGDCCACWSVWSFFWAPAYAAMHFGWPRQAEFWILIKQEQQCFRILKDSLCLCVFLCVCTYGEHSSPKPKVSVLGLVFFCFYEHRQVAEFVFSQLLTCEHKYGFIRVMPETPDSSLFQQNKKSWIGFLSAGAAGRCKQGEAL